MLTRIVNTTDAKNEISASKVETTGILRPIVVQQGLRWALELPASDDEPQENLDIDMAFLMLYRDPKFFQFLIEYNDPKLSVLIVDAAIISAIFNYFDFIKELDKIDISLWIKYKKLLNNSSPNQYDYLNAKYVLKALIAYHFPKIDNKDKRISLIEQLTNWFFNHCIYSQNHPKLIFIAHSSPAFQNRAISFIQLKRIIKEISEAQVTEELVVDKLEKIIIKHSTPQNHDGVVKTFDIKEVVPATKNEAKDDDPALTIYKEFVLTNPRIFQLYINFLLRSTTTYERRIDINDARNGADISNWSSNQKINAELIAPYAGQIQAGAPQSSIVKKTTKALERAIDDKKQKMSMMAQQQLKNYLEFSKDLEQSAWKKWYIVLLKRYLEYTDSQEARLLMSFFLVEEALITRNMALLSKEPRKYLLFNEKAISYAEEAVQLLEKNLIATEAADEKEVLRYNRHLLEPLAIIILIARSIGNSEKCLFAHIKMVDILFNKNVAVEISYDVLMKYHIYARDYATDYRAYLMDLLKLANGYLARNDYNQAIVCSIKASQTIIDKRAKEKIIKENINSALSRIDAAKKAAWESNDFLSQMDAPYFYVRLMFLADQISRLFMNKPSKTKSDIEQADRYMRWAMDLLKGCNLPASKQISLRMGLDLINIREGRPIDHLQAEFTRVINFEFNRIVTEVTFRYKKTPQLLIVSQEYKTELPKQKTLRKPKKNSGRHNSNKQDTTFSSAVVTTPQQLLESIDYNLSEFDGLMGAINTFQKEILKFKEISNMTGGALYYSTQEKLLEQFTNTAQIKCTEIGLKFKTLIEAIGDEPEKEIRQALVNQYKTSRTLCLKELSGIYTYLEKIWKTTENKLTEYLLEYLSSAELKIPQQISEIKETNAKLDAQDLAIKNVHQPIVAIFQEMKEESFDPAIVNCRKKIDSFKDQHEGIMAALAKGLVEINMEIRQWKFLENNLTKGIQLKTIFELIDNYKEQQINSWLQLIKIENKFRHFGPRVKAILRNLGEKNVTESIAKQINDFESFTNPPINSLLESILLYRDKINELAPNFTVWESGDYLSRQAQAENLLKTAENIKVNLATQLVTLTEEFNLWKNMSASDDKSSKLSNLYDLIDKYQVELEKNHAELEKINNKVRNFYDELADRLGYLKLRAEDEAGAKEAKIDQPVVVVEFESDSPLLAMLAIREREAAVVAPALVPAVVVVEEGQAVLQQEGKNYSSPLQP